MAAERGAVRAETARATRADEPVEERGGPAYAAEFIGTFLLVASISLFLTVSNSVPGSGVGFSLASLALLHAFVLGFLIYTLGGTSGAHFNPAVSIALAALRKISPVNAAIYIAAQLAGGVCGALLCRVVLVNEGKPLGYGATLVNHGATTTAGALVLEIFGTFVLMWAIMGTAVNPRGAKDWAGLVIGSTLGFAVMIAGPITGAGFNPARSFGPALVSGKFSDFWIYIVGPLAGALIAAFGYHAIEIAPKGRIERRPIDTLD